MQARKVVFVAQTRETRPCALPANHTYRCGKGGKGPATRDGLATAATSGYCGNRRGEAGRRGGTQRRSNSGLPPSQRGEGSRNGRGTAESRHRNEVRSQQGRPKRGREGKAGLQGREGGRSTARKGPSASGWRWGVGARARFERRAGRNGQKPGLSRQSNHNQGKGERGNQVGNGDLGRA